MSIELSSSQVDVLRGLVQVRVANLSSEIRHTDSPRVRAELREERELLRALLLDLEPVAA